MTVQYNVTAASGIPTGNDILNGGNDDDILHGSLGNGTLTGCAGADSFSGEAGTDITTDFNASQGDTQDGTIP